MSPNSTLSLVGKQVVLGITGGIAAYKSIELIRLLTKSGATVRVVLTESAKQFVTPTTLQAISGHDVYSSLWESPNDQPMAHINLSRDADIIIIAPATANTLAKLAQGLADDLLSTICLARPKHVPLIVAPAMNKEMWDHPATLRNVKQIKQDGVHVVGPNVGIQACGETGEGRMLEPEELLHCIDGFLTQKILKDLRILITAGPTQENIDPIRILTNHSSGKMGYAIAHVAHQMGAKVTLVSGPTALSSPAGVRLVSVSSAKDMLEEVLGYASRADIFIGVAAVADWTVSNPQNAKIKKEKQSSVPSIELSETTDILATVAHLPTPPFCIGFAAETHYDAKQAQDKRKRKNIPLLVVNIGTETFGQDENQVWIVDDKGETVLPKQTKIELAMRLLTLISQNYKNNDTQSN
jgi:phosphopantothenoylcysteine decarboxylase/phosphopantothenate--cysteine ligase